MPGKPQSAALIASARVALLLSGSLVLGRSAPGGTALIAVALLSWGVSLGLGASLYRSRRRDGWANVPGADLPVADTDGAAGRSGHPAEYQRVLMTRARARRDHAGSRSG
jgi:hypothetical protein